MSIFKNTEEKAFLETMQAMFPNSSYEEIIAIIKRKKNINPEEEEFLRSIQELSPNINYQSITHIIQLMSEKCSDKDLEHLENIMENAISLITDAESLKQQYQQKSAEYTTSIQSLEKQRQSAEQELQDLQQKIEKLKQKEAEYEEKNKRLISRIQEIENQKRLLQAEIDGLNKIIQQYNQQIQQITNQNTKIPTTQYVVEWLPIAENDPIYDTNYKTIQDYINSLIYIHSEKTGLSFEEASDIFFLNNEKLKGLITTIKSLHDQRERSISLRIIITPPEEFSLSYYYYYDENAKYEKGRLDIINRLSTLRFPHYTPQNEVSIPEATPIWTPITETDRIYEQNVETIEDYIDSLITTYANNTQINKEKAIIEFKKYMPAYPALIDSLKKIGIKGNIRSIINKERNSYESEKQFHFGCIIKQIISTLKVPQYIPLEKNKKNNVIPNETKQQYQFLNRELYWKKQITLAYTKIALLEAERQTLLEQLKLAQPNSESLYEQLCNPEIEITNLVDSLFGAPKVGPTVTHSH